MIELDRVVKEYQGRRVVDDFSLTVPEGAFCVLLGTSGCGKSTTLRMINRLVPFDAGAIRIDGADVREVSTGRAIGSAIGSPSCYSCSGSPRRPTATNSRTSCPAASSRGSASLVRWPPIPICC
jgi:energy-coupling factor transporter ATP-binding protein EcfA2